MHIIKGDISIDDRGSVSYVNDFDFKNVKRFYIVENHQVGFIRAWHAHKLEAKYVQVVSGSAMIAGVKIDGNWENPSKNLEISKFVLSEKKPSILFIPAGYANGFKTLTPQTKIIFYSTSKLDDSLNDDYRFKFDYWNPWNFEYR
jgi:dTDP-4-dehydrorhamnose 3,5-epimerase-like enzyme